MSQLLKAKQRLQFRSNSILQSAEEDSQLKILHKKNSGPTNPKLYSQINHKNRQKAINHLHIQDDDQQYRVQIRRISPVFSKTGRSQFGGKVMINDALSDRGQHMNLVNKQQMKTRRITQYSKGSGAGQEISFFDNQQQSVYNESPEKAIKNTVHNGKLNIIIAKIPNRRAISPFKPRQCQLRCLEERLQQQNQSNQRFVDDMFPPRFTIIFNKKYMYLEQGLRLQRITKIYQGQQIRLLKYCQPALMVPGKYTSPALYSALLILSEQPTRILNILGNQQYNQNGIYYTHICKDGIWRYIIVDDYLPVKILARRSLLFLHTLAQNGIYEFWPSIIEKALAKVYGTYQDIYLTSNKGVCDIIRNLTGYPVSKYQINKDFRTYLIIIDAAIKKKQIVVLQQISQQFIQTAHIKGIQANLSYQVIQVKKSYIVIRNFAEKQLITKLTFQEALLFCKLMIFRSQNGYNYISRTLRHKRNCFSQIKVTIKSPTRCYWDIWQNCEVYYKNHIGSHIYYRKSKYAIKFLKQQKQNKQNKQNSDIQADYQLQNLTESGKQIIMNEGIYYLNIHLCQQKQQDFVISYYGEQNVQIQRVKNRERWEDQQCQCN